MAYRAVEDWMEDPLIDKIAGVAYTAINHWNIRTQQTFDHPWDILPQDYRDHIKLVVARAFAEMKTPTAKQLHERCYEDGLASGWTYGAEMDRKNKRHPDVQPWAKLSPDQRMKDHIMSGIIRAFLEGS